MSQYHSISLSGMSLFERPIESVVGGIVVDLASAPLAPGHHELHIDVSIGGIEIYVPSYVQLTMDGGASIGGVDVHDGLGWLERIERATRKLFRLSNQVPAHAPPPPDEPISIRCVINGGIGGIDIYRLPPNA